MGDSDAEFVDAESNTFAPNVAMSSPSTKRKGSPISVSDIKRQNSLPNIANLANLSPLRPKTKNATMSELIIKTMKEPTFQKDAAPVLAGLITPFVESAIANLSTNITALTETNKKLQETVEKQCILLQSNQSIIDNQQKQLDNQSSEIKSLTGQVNDLSNELIKE